MFPVVVITNMLPGILILCFLITTVSSHGMLMNPAQRSSLWRAGFTSPANYNDMGLNCGGLSYQWETHGGKCGLCGDPVGAAVKPNEAGGKYANNIIARTYNAGETVTMTARLTANHLGYFEFRLCDETTLSKECLDKHVLTVYNKGLPSKRFYVGTDSKDYDVRVQIPAGISCNRCVIQWLYNAGNNWGVNENGVGCKGCAKKQEQFINCADVKIVNTNGSIKTKTTTTSPAKTTTGAAAPTTTAKQATTTAKPAATTAKPTTAKPTTAKPTTTAPMITHKPDTPTKPTTKAPNPNSKCPCKSFGAWAGRADIDQYCQTHCPGYCPVIMCDCSCEPLKLTCTARAPYDTYPGMADWCTGICLSYPESCPKSHCECS